MYRYYTHTHTSVCVCVCVCARAPDRTLYLPTFSLLLLVNNLLPLALSLSLSLSLTHTHTHTHTHKREGGRSFKVNAATMQPLAWRTRRRPIGSAWPKDCDVLSVVWGRKPHCLGRDLEPRNRNGAETKSSGGEQRGDQGEGVAGRHALPAKPVVSSQRSPVIQLTHQSDVTTQLLAMTQTLRM